MEATSSLSEIDINETSLHYTRLDGQSDQGRCNDREANQFDLPLYADSFPPVSALAYVCLWRRIA